MKKIIAMMILFTTSIAFSQVGIGTTSPDSSSMLDITTSSKGLLIPKSKFNFNFRCDYNSKSSG